ncbi:uncharacterized protein LOC134288241 isoform X2 [Aedes albopictus]|uniref:Uncharacterized protein n=1 Tax=Aedes albopictus TaxID=7160 RepID=A0ABM1ZSS7_AEDAL
MFVIVVVGGGGRRRLSIVVIDTSRADHGVHECSFTTSTITADELEEALQRTCLSEGYVWNTKQIFDRIYQWQQKNQLALQTLPKHEQIPADERQDLTGETAASRIEASDPLPLPEKSIEFVKISDGQEKVETSDRSCSFDAGCSYRKSDQILLTESVIGPSRSTLLRLVSQEITAAEQPTQSSSLQDPTFTLLVNAPEDGEFLSDATNTGQLFNNLDTDDGGGHGTGQALVSTQVSVKSETIYPERTLITQSQHPSQYQTSLLSSTSQDSAILLFVKAPGSAASPDQSRQLLSNLESDDCSGHGSDQALEGTNSIQSSIKVQEALVRKTSVLSSNAPGGSVSLKDITNIKQHSSDQNAAGCSGSGSGLGVVDENLVGRKLFSPSALLEISHSGQLQQRTENQRRTEFTDRDESKTPVYFLTVLERLIYSQSIFT